MLVFDKLRSGGLQEATQAEILGEMDRATVGEN